MSEVTIPLALLVLGTAAILWEMVRAERSGRRDMHDGSLAAAPERGEDTEGTEAAAGK